MMLTVQALFYPSRNIYLFFYCNKTNPLNDLICRCFHVSIFIIGSARILLANLGTNILINFVIPKEKYIWILDDHKISLCNESHKLHQSRPRPIEHKCSHTKES